MRPGPEVPVPGNRSNLLADLVSLLAHQGNSSHLVRGLLVRDKVPRLGLVLILGKVDSHPGPVLVRSRQARRSHQARIPLHSNPARTPDRSKGRTPGRSLLVLEVRVRVARSRLVLARRRSRVVLGLRLGRGRLGLRTRDKRQGRVSRLDLVGLGDLEDRRGVYRRMGCRAGGKGRLLWVPEVLPEQEALVDRADLGHQKS